MLEELTLGLLASESSDAAPNPIATDIATLVGLHSPLLYRMAFSVLRNPAEAEDVVQETFLRAISAGKLNSIPAAIPSRIKEPRLWLMRITWNLSLDRKRRITPQQLDDSFAASLAAQTVGAEAAIDHARSITRVLAAIELLPSLERAALQLSAIDSLSTAEIAKLLNRTQAGIRGLLHRARTHLRQRLESPTRLESKEVK
jgi:RNA polymerase sigma-70 factor (ECF subfamily)